MTVPLFLPIVLLLLGNVFGETQHVHAVGSVVDISEHRLESKPDNLHRLPPPLDRREYDGASRLRRTINNAGGISYRQYDALGHTTASIDQSGNAVATYFDIAGRALRTEWVLTTSGAGPGSGQVGTPDSSQGGGDGLIGEEAEYDLNGRLILRRDDNANETVFEFDSLDRMIATIQADSTVETYAYDPNGNVVERTDYNGTVFVQGFDTLNRLEIATPVIATGNPHALIETGSQRFGYDGLSRMVLAIEENGGVTETARVFYTYDSLAHVLSEQQLQGDLMGSPLELTVTAQYDGVGNLLTLAGPSGFTVERTHDVLERLAGIEASGPGVTGTADVAGYSYAGPSRVRARANDNAGLALEVGYDSLRRPVSWTHAHTVSGTAVDIQYGYDAVGNRLWERRLHDGDKGKRYAYDSAYRLLQTLEGVIASNGTLSGPATTSETAVYDGVGNRVSLDRDGTVKSYDTNELNQYREINGVTLTYDANGNLQANPEGEYRYDAFNRLRSAAGNNGDNSYLYDARGRRVRRVASGSGSVAGEWTFAYFESRSIEEYAGAGGGSVTLSASVVFGIGVDEVLMQVKSGGGAGGGILWNMEDALGSVVAVAGVGGAVLERYRYESFGRPTFLEADGAETSDTASAVGNRFLFTGREFEPETGLYFYRARYYSPGLGRFLSRDPAEYVDGLNLYAYVTNNPINRSDPMGLWWGPYQQAVKTFESVKTRAVGALKVIGGFAEAAVGVGALAAPEPTATKAVGVVLVAHGADTMAAGAKQTWTGENTETHTHDAVRATAEAAGASPETANKLAGNTELGLSAFGTGMTVLRPRPPTTLPPVDVPTASPAATPTGSGASQARTATSAGSGDAVVATTAGQATAAAPSTSALGGRMLAQGLKEIQKLPAGERAAATEALVSKVEVAVPGWKASRMPAAGGGRAWSGETNSLVVDGKGNVAKGANADFQFGKTEQGYGVTEWPGRVKTNDGE